MTHDWPWRECPPPFPGMRCLQKRLADGHLNLLLATEDGLLHMSISHRTNERKPKPGRNPTWEEIRDARYEHCPTDIDMVMHLPPIDEYVAVHDTTFHLWELRR